MKLLCISAWNYLKIRLLFACKSLLLRRVTKRLWRISDCNSQNFPKTRGIPIDTSHFPCILLTISSPEKTQFLLKGNRTFPCVLACFGLFWPVLALWCDPVQVTGHWNIFKKIKLYPSEGSTVTEALACLCTLNLLFLMTSNCLNSLMPECTTSTFCFLFGRGAVVGVGAVFHFPACT